MKIISRLALLALGLVLSLATVSTALAEKDTRGRSSERGRGHQDVRQATHEARGEASHEERELKAKALHGAIQSISGTIWTIERGGHREGTFRIDVGGARVHWPEREGATLADFHVGDTVNVQLEHSDRGHGENRAQTSADVLRARAVHFVPSKRAHGEHEESARFEGAVTAVSGASLTVNNTSLGSRTFTLTGATKVRLGSGAATLNDIRVTDKVTVATEEGSTVAKDVRIQLERFSGSVTAVSSTSLTVNSRDLGSRIFNLASTTKVRIGDETGTLTDIHVGDRVRVSTRFGDSTALTVMIRR